MEIRKDILGNIPEIDDLIVFNPPKYKGLIVGKVIGFSKSGLPQLKFKNPTWNCPDGYTPKTEFVVVRELINYEIY